MSGWGVALSKGDSKRTSSRPTERSSRLWPPVNVTPISSSRIAARPLLLREHAIPGTHEAMVRPVLSSSLNSSQLGRR